MRINRVLHGQYGITAQIGLIISLLVVNLAFQADWNPDIEFEIVLPGQEHIPVDEIPPTKVPDQPPPPPKPPVPVEVPDDEVLEEEELNLDAFLDLEAPAAATPPPPPPKKEEAKEEEPEIFVIVEQMPTLIGGLASIHSEIKYPEIAKKAGVSGTVFVQFVVDVDGSVVVEKDAEGKIINSPAVRAIRQVKFKPGMQRGKAVKVRFSIPITFKLK